MEQERRKDPKGGVGEEQKAVREARAQRHNQKKEKRIISHS